MSGLPSCLQTISDGHDEQFSTLQKRPSKERASHRKQALCHDPHAPNLPPEAAHHPGEEHARLPARAPAQVRETHAQAHVLRHRALLAQERVQHPVRVPVQVHVPVQAPVLAQERETHAQAHVLHRHHQVLLAQDHALAQVHASVREREVHAQAHVLRHHHQALLAQNHAHHHQAHTQLQAPAPAQVQAQEDAFRHRLDRKAHGNDPKAVILLKGLRQERQNAHILPERPLVHHPQGDHHQAADRHREDHQQDALRADLLRASVRQALQDQRGAEILDKTLPPASVANGNSQASARYADFPMIAAIAGQVSAQYADFPMTAAIAEQALAHTAEAASVLPCVPLPAVVRRQVVAHDRAKNRHSQKILQEPHLHVPLQEIPLVRHQKQRTVKMPNVQMLMPLQALPEALRR